MPIDLSLVFVLKECISIFEGLAFLVGFGKSGFGMGLSVVMSGSHSQSKRRSGFVGIGIAVERTWWSGTGLA